MSLLVSLLTTDFFESPLECLCVETETVVLIAVRHMEDVDDITPLTDTVMVGKLPHDIVSPLPTHLFGHDKPVEMVKNRDDANFFVYCG